MEMSVSEETRVSKHLQNILIQLFKCNNDNGHLIYFLVWKKDGTSSDI